MNKQEYGDAGWSVSISSVAFWQRRVLCAALPGVVESPQN